MLICRHAWVQSVLVHSAFVVKVQALHLHHAWLHGRLQVMLLSCMQTWREDTARFTQLQDVHAWLHSTHLCYSVSRQVSEQGLR